MTKVRAPNDANSAAVDGPVVATELASGNTAIRARPAPPASWTNPLRTEGGIGPPPTSISVPPDWTERGGGAAVASTDRARPAHPPVVTANTRAGSRAMTAGRLRR